MVDGFSDKYSGKIIIGNEEGYFLGHSGTKSTLIIFNNTSQEESIRQTCYIIVENLPEQDSTNVQQVPREIQKLFISRDFNFDGVKNLALGHGSCYMAKYYRPVYQIYLDKDDKLIFSPELSRLTGDEENGYCDLFRIDPKSQTLHTSYYSGSMNPNSYYTKEITFKLFNDIPKPILIEERQGWQLPFYNTTTIEWEGGRVYDMKGDVNTVKGGLQHVDKAQFKNVRNSQ